MGKRGLGQKKFEQPKCLVCDAIYKHYKFIDGSMIKNICKCNEYLLDKESERIRQKQIKKESHPDYKGTRTIEFKG